MKNENPAFSIQYDKSGTPIGVTSDKLTVTAERGQELPRDVTTETVVNTTIVVGHHNPGCRYIWIPGWGWVWVCW